MKMFNRLRTKVPEKLPEPSPVGEPIFPLPAVAGSPTSRQAAAEMGRERVRRDELTVFNAVLVAGDAGLTDDELEVVTGIIHQTVSARRNGLVKKHKIRNSGQVRPTRSGKMAIVWVLGEGVPIKGALNHRAVRRPSSDELRAAASCLAGQNDTLERVRTWLIYLADG